ncbi:MAG: siphovirus Gp157 family protein [Methylobacter sp.]|nr:siphovirus Gp157 family protein [Methylobacter sp.]MDP2429446.1 siphovirus Gp157 family protein [Methylobacter sp.]MDP3055571.1 siphovirus Gp157 family protein [Methylobacter sp.]MDP3363417.1 siphovirus Gp157 family protein [Methylobacter sp.]
MKLYSITHEYRQALAVLNNADLTDLAPDEKQQLLNDTLSPFYDQFETKALAIGAFISNLSLEADALKTMETRIQLRRKANERKVEWLTDYLHTNMEAMRLLDIKDDQIHLAVRKNPPKVIVTDEIAIPACYKAEVVTVSVKKSLIAEAIKQGGTVAGAYLQSSTRLQIK